MSVNLSRAVREPWAWVAVVTAVALVAALAALVRTRPVPPPVLFSVPEFRFTNEDGQPFGSEELRGRVWAMDFIFTRCSSLCPKLADAFTAVRDHSADIAGSFHLVSLSVDPDHDTPAVLREYAVGHGAKGRNWHFLTAPAAETRAFIMEGLKVPVGEREDPANVQDLFHSPVAVLVDHRLQVRGYFDVTKPEQREALVSTARLLLEERGP